MNRAVTVAIAYLMQKYSWTLEKAQKYYRSKVHKDDVYDVREFLVKQLQDFEKYLQNEEKRTLSNDFIFEKEVNTEEQMMVNTWINSQNMVSDRISLSIKSVTSINKGKNLKKKKNLKWANEVAQLIPHKENLDIDIEKFNKNEKNNDIEERVARYINSKNSRRGSTPAKLSTGLGRRIENLKNLINKNKNLSK